MFNSSTKAKDKKISRKISDERLSGKLTIIKRDGQNMISLMLNEQPDGYADIDFTKKGGFIKKQDEIKNWIQIRLIKSLKARLYNSPDISSIRKGYLIQNDVVKIISKKSDGWCKIEFNPINNNSKSTIVWIRESDLYNVSTAN